MDDAREERAESVEVWKDVRLVRSVVGSDMVRDWYARIWDRCFAIEIRSKNSSFGGTVGPGWCVDLRSTSPRSFPRDALIITNRHFRHGWSVATVSSGFVGLLVPENQPS